MLDSHSSPVVEQDTVRRPIDMHEVGAVVDLSAAMHERSVYSHLQFSHDKMRLLCTLAFADNDEWTQFFRVSVRDGKPIGFMLAYVSEYFFGPQIIAQDYAVYVDPDHSNSRDAARMIKQYIKWARERGAAEVCLGVTAGIDNDRVARLYKRLGFERTGYVYKMRAM